MNALHKFGRSLMAGRNRVLPAAVIAALLVAAPAFAADLYWDGGDGTWNAAGNWSTDPANPMPNPVAVPGAADTAHFNRSGNNGVAQTINLGAVQSALGLVFSNTDTTNLNGLPANHGLNLLTGGITVNSGAGAVTLGSLTANEEMALVLDGSQTWTNNSASPLTIVNQVSYFSGSQLTLDGSGTGLSTIQGNMPFGGLMGIVKNGTGTWVLTGNNTPGATFINDGKIIANNPGGLSLGGVIVGDGAGAAGSAVLEFGDDDQLPANSLTTINSDGKVDLNGKNQTFGDIATNGFDLNNGNLVNSGAGTILLGANSRVNSAGGTNTVTGGTIDMGGAARVGVTSGTMTVSSTLINGGITASAGTLTLTGVGNNLTVGTTVNGGILNINSNGAIGTGALNYSTGTIDNTSGGAVAVSPISTTVANVTFGGTNDLTINGPWNWATTATRIVSVSGTTGKVTFTGVATPGGLTNAFAKAGAGTLELTGNNLWQGITTIRVGTLSVSSIANINTPQPLGNNAAVTIGQSTNSATLEYTGGTASTNYPITLVNNAAAATQAINVTNSNTTLTLTGSLITGNANQTFSKGGAGSLVLASTGTFSYASKTVVKDNGKLIINGAKTGTADVTVQDTATLGGTGSIAGAVTAQSGTTIAPGANAGSLVLGSTFNLQSNATMAIELGGTTFNFNTSEDYDRLKVTGASTLAGQLSVSLINSFSLGANQLFGIVDAVGGRSGVFSNFAEGDTVLTNSGYFLKITYAGDVTDGAVALTGGSDIVLYTVAIPEPSSLALMGVATLGLAALNRRRRNRVR